MAEHPNIELIRRGYQAFSSGDAETLRQLLAPDAVHRVPGNNRISGDHKGIDAILTLYGQIGALTNGTVRVDLLHVLVNDQGQAVAVHRSTGERNGKRIDTIDALLFTFSNGRVVEISDLFPDLDEQDQFWS
jgi:uncharacterized protein